MIRTIVFDFGNVFLDLDYPKFNAGLQRLLNFDLEKDSLPQSVKHIFEQYEMGFCSEDDILLVLNEFRPGVQKEDFKEVWNSLLQEIPAHRLTWLKALSKTYELALLSNINHWHRQWADEHLETVHGIRAFEKTYFSNYYYSYEIGMRKPNDNIYEHVAAQLAQHPQQLFFIDDTQTNIETALRMDWKAIRHNPNDDIVTEFSTYIKSL